MCYQLEAAGLLNFFEYISLPTSYDSHVPIFAVLKEGLLPLRSGGQPTMQATAA